MEGTYLSLLVGDIVDIILLKLDDVDNFIDVLNLDKNRSYRLLTIDRVVYLADIPDYDISWVPVYKLLRNFKRGTNSEDFVNIDTFERLHRLCEGSEEAY